jgi:hypothetical protein
MMGKTMKEMTIREIVEKASGIRQEENEDYQKYLNRLGDEADRKMSQKQFDRLREDAQGWLEGAVAAFDKGKPAPDFPDKGVENLEREVKKPLKIAATKTIMDLMVKNPKWGIDKLGAELNKLNVKYAKGTLNTTYRSTKYVLEKVFAIEEKE